MLSEAGHHSKLVDYHFLNYSNYDPTVQSHSLSQKRGFQVAFGSQLIEMLAVMDRVAQTLKPKHCNTTLRDNQRKE